MLAKHKIINDILDIGIVAIVRTDASEKAKNIIDACVQGGLRSVEIAFTVDKAHNIIEDITNNQDKTLTLGAGTVLDSETARTAILSGASYIVSPCFDKATAKLCNRYAVPYLAGCYAPAEIVRAMDYGVEIIKLFPGSLLSPKAVQVLKAPLPQANIMPTGGVNINNAEEWIAAGAVALGVGGDLVAGAKTGDYASITKQAILYRTAITQARAKHQL